MKEIVLVLKKNVDTSIRLMYFESFINYFH